VRVICNLIEAHLVENLDEKGREEFEATLYEPVQGWQDVERQFWRRIQDAPDS
jgi:hypothetical protein